MFLRFREAHRLWVSLMLACIPRCLFAKLTLETWVLTELVCRQGCLWKTLPEWFDKAEMTGRGAEDAGSVSALGWTRRHRQTDNAMGFGHRARESMFRIHSLTIIGAL